LQYSVNAIDQFGIKSEYTENEYEAFESLTARFARATDILTQKVLKTFFQIIQENFHTFLDVADLAEKFEIVEKAETLIVLRDLRNQIAHEYEEEELNRLFGEIVNNTPELIRIIEKANTVINLNLNRL
jgi:uncharacterized protein with HEPN domain